MHCRILALLLLAALPRGPAQPPTADPGLQPRCLKILKTALDGAGPEAFWAVRALSTRYGAVPADLIREHLSRVPSNAFALNRTADPRLAEELLPFLEQRLETADDQTAMNFAAAIARAPGDRPLRAISHCAETRGDPAQGVCFGLLPEMGSRAVPALIRLAASERPVPRTVAVRILGDLSDPSLRAVFQQNLAWRVPSVRFASALALARLGDRQGALVLRQALGSAGETQRDPAPAARAVRGHVSQPGALSESVIGVYPTQSDEALVALAALFDASQLRALCEALRTRPESSRMGLLYDMGRYRTPAFRELLEAASRDASANVRSAAAEGLAKQEGGLRGPLLTRLLADPNTGVRLVAAIGASRHGDRMAAAELSGIARTTGDPLRLNALEFLRTHAAEFLPALRSLLRDPNANVRLAALTGVVAAGAAADVDLIQPLAEDEGSSIVLEAVNGIATLSPSDKLQRLAPLLDSRNRCTRIAAAAALVDGPTAQR